MDDRYVQILEGLGGMRFDEGKSKNNKMVVKNCKTLLKMIDNDINVTVKNKLRQIIMLSSSEDLKTDVGSLDDAIANLDLFLKVIAKLDV